MNLKEMTMFIIIITTTATAEETSKRTHCASSKTVGWMQKLNNIHMNKNMEIDIHQAIKHESKFSISYNIYINNSIDLLLFSSSPLVK